MNELICALVAVFIVIMGGKALRGYPAYKGSLSPQLFGSYAEFFWRAAVKEDLSESMWLREKIGFHRLAYSSAVDGKGRPVSSLTTVFSVRGHTVICVVEADGALSGGDDGAWNVERGGRTVTLASPVVHLRRQQRFLGAFLKGVPVDYVIACGPCADYSGVSCSYPVMHIADVLPYLEARSVSGVSERDVLRSFEAFKERAKNGKIRTAR